MCIAETLLIRGVVEGVQKFGRSVKHIQTRGGLIMLPHYCRPPGFQKTIYTFVNRMENLIFSVTKIECVSCVVATGISYLAVID